MGEITDIEEPLMEYAEANGFIQRKFVVPGRKGPADRVLSHHKTGAFFMELKVLDGKISRRQVKEAKAWMKGGIPTYFVASVEQGVKVLDHIRLKGVFPDIPIPKSGKINNV